MRVVAFAPALSTTQEDAGGVLAKGFPMTACYVRDFPDQIVVPVVVAVVAQGGSEYDVRRYIVATAADGERVGALEFSWHWPDNPPVPVKFRVFSHNLSIHVPSAGVYTLGLYETLDGTDTDHVFPLPVLKFNPLTQTPSG